MMALRQLREWLAFSPVYGANGNVPERSATSKLARRANCSNLKSFSIHCLGRPGVADVRGRGEEPVEPAQSEQVVGCPVVYHACRVQKGPQPVHPLGVQLRGHPS